jgi:LmbE family N-acetylglucosaminyl deacetylase
MSNVIGWQVEQLRRFKPLVAVGHDRYGEYGHAAHMMNGQSLESSVKLSGDKRHFGRSADTWGVWTPQKLYLHFAPENQITLDLEHPLEHFGGRTAFEVACDAMQFHKSQLKYKHRPTLDDEDFPRYDCRLFGLVRSSVGEDTGSDIMENTYRDEPET